MSLWLFVAQCKRPYPPSIFGMSSGRSDCTGYAASEENRLGPPGDGDNTGVETGELLEGAHAEVERAPVAGRAGVGNGRLDGLAVTLDPDLLAAHARVHLSAVNSNDRGGVAVPLTARARVAVLC